MLKPLDNPYNALLQVVRIVTTRKDGRTGTGTGFFYYFCHEQRPNNMTFGVPCLVTNKHVLKDILKGSFVVNRRDSNRCLFGSTVEVKFNCEAWIHHPENLDLSILPINPILGTNGLKVRELFISDLYVKLLPNDHQWKGFGPIENIITIGYPNGFWDEKNNIPIARRGLTATHPMLNYKGKDDFLIDISIYPGISGSPVFIRDFGSEWYEKGSHSVGERTYFIGIVYAMAKYSNKPGLVKEFIATESTSKMEISNLVSNLGFAIKSTKLREFDPIIKELLSNNSG